MSAPRTPSRRTWPGVVLDVVLGLVAVTALLWCGLAAFLVASSLLAPGPEEGGTVDPHGYSRIFGTVMFVVGLPVLLAAGAPFVRRLRTRGRGEDPRAARRRPRG
ncbi:hypothetical protein [Nocardioides litoris]|uniref:hypothetical protein n=1 Tax=Nocardioides litoris TaxID=1926648 RepID=UPI001120228E|nr:hypothetical protein [Nocardioides litoris]